MTIERAAEAIASRTPEEYAFKHNLLMICAILLLAIGLMLIAMYRRKARYRLNENEWKELSRISETKGTTPDELTTQLLRNYIDRNRTYSQ